MKCAPRANLEHRLAMMGELKTNAGPAGFGKVLVTLYQKADGSTWTLVVHDTKGLSCIIAAGHDWIKLAPGAAGVKH